jgi:hypothetical protein
MVGYKQTMCRHAVATWVVLCFASIAFAQAPAGISIRILEGDGAINSIRLHRAHDPVVQVLDRTGEPVSGATVTFLLPASGPSGEFQSSGLSLTIDTGPDGRAAAHGLRPNALPGQFRIRVAVSYQGQAANTTLTQTNAEPVVKSKSSKTIVILAVIGAAVAGGAAAAASHGGSSNSSTPPTGNTGGSSSGAVIVAGSPGFGPPH